MRFLLVLYHTFIFFCTPQDYRTYLPHLPALIINTNVLSHNLPGLYIHLPFLFLFISFTTLYKIYPSTISILLFLLSGEYALQLFFFYPNTLFIIFFLSTPLTCCSPNCFFLQFPNSSSSQNQKIYLF